MKIGSTYANKKADILAYAEDSKENPILSLKLGTLCVRMEWSNEHYSTSKYLAQAVSLIVTV